MRPEKQSAVEELKAKIESATAVIFTGYTGASAEQMADLRAALDARHGRYVVVKNRLFALAARAVGLPDELPGFQGQVGVALTDEESSIPVLKALVAFRREHEAVELLGGFVAGRPHSAAALKELSKLPSRPVMQAQVLGVLQAAPRGLVSVVAGRLRSVLYLLRAHVEKQGGVPAEAAAHEAEGAPSGEPVPEEPAEAAAEPPTAVDEPASEESAQESV